jgi:hypothetical protein
MVTSLTLTRVLELQPTSTRRRSTTTTAVVGHSEILLSGQAVLDVGRQIRRRVPPKASVTVAKLRDELSEQRVRVTREPPILSDSTNGVSHSGYLPTVDVTVHDDHLMDRSHPLTHHPVRVFTLLEQPILTTTVV